MSEVTSAKTPTACSNRKHKFNKISALHWVTHLMEAGSVNLVSHQIPLLTYEFVKFRVSALTLTTQLSEVKAAAEYQKDPYLMIGSRVKNPAWERGVHNRDQGLGNQDESSFLFYLMLRY